MHKNFKNVKGSFGRLGLLFLAGVFLAGCASHYFKSLQQNRLHYAAEQIQQSVDEISELNNYARENQQDLLAKVVVVEGWPYQDITDTQSGIERRAASVEHYLLGLTRAKQQILAASRELAQQSEWIFYDRR